MPNRTIKESCRTSESLDKLSDFAIRMWWALITVADDYGRFPADPRVLLASCFPLKVETLKVDKVEKAWREIEAVGGVKRYKVEGRTYGFFVSWGAHNTPRASKSKYPPPADENICTQMHADAPVVDLRSRSTNTNTHTAPNGGGSEFDRFWTVYPKKRSKGDAEKAWNQTAKERPDLETVLASVRAQAASDGWTKDSGQFIPHPATWLRRKGWLDELPGRPDAVPREPERNRVFAPGELD